MWFKIESFSLSCFIFPTAFVIALRSKEEPVKDHHHLLQPMCECLEHIFFKGLKGKNKFNFPRTCRLKKVFFQIIVMYMYASVIILSKSCIKHICCKTYWVRKTELDVIVNSHMEIASSINFEVGRCNSQGKYFTVGRQFGISYYQASDLSAYTCIKFVGRKVKAAMALLLKKIFGLVGAVVISNFFSLCSFLFTLVFKNND